MYLRAVHAESRVAVLQQLIRENPLGILTTAIKSSIYPFIQSSHIPFVLDVPDEPAAASTDASGSAQTANGRLRGHLARQNPQAKAIIDALEAKKTTKANTESHGVLDDEVLILFTASPHHYVTPQFYTETKPDSGKVVPTWNYAAVQAYGRAKIFYDSRSEETGGFLQRQIEDLSQHVETSVMGYTGEGGKRAAWNVSDAPERYIGIMKKNIIGIEIQVERLEGKFKMSQELTQGDREGVIEGFSRLGADASDAMVRLIRERGDLKTVA